MMKSKITYDDASRRACTYETRFKGKKKTYEYNGVQENLLV